MAKVLFIIRLPADENDLKGIYDEVKDDTKDKNDNQKQLGRHDEMPELPEEDKGVTNKTDSTVDTDIKSEFEGNDQQNTIVDPGWDFGDQEQSEGSANFSTAESSPDKTTGDKKTKSQEPPSNDFEEKKSNSKVNTATDVPNEQKGTKTDLEPEINHADSELNPLLAEVSEKSGKESIDANTDIATEKVGEEENVTGDHPELVRFVSQETTLRERVKSILQHLKVTGVQWSLTEDNIYVGMFIAGDGAECEEILNRLSVLRIGIISKSSVSIFPANISIASVQEEEEAVQLQNKLEREDKLEEKVEEFKKTIKSKLVIQEVINNVESDAAFSFDYVMLIVLASFVALLGLLEASSVVLVASMLISPLMGPILAGVLGTVIRNTNLLILGTKSELKGLAICIVVGFVVGLIPAGLEAAQLNWRSSESWPTIEMSSRGALRALPVGVMIALPSGAGVALSVLGGKVGSLVGVAISASLLPPAVNAGLLWANAFLVAFVPPPTETFRMINISRFLSNETSIDDEERYGYAFSTDCPPLIDNSFTQHYFCNMAAESAVLGVISLLLTLLNILCIIVMGVVVLKIKEVAPLPSAPDVEQEFYGKTLKVARDSYQTTKGKSSLLLRDKFLQEYKSFKDELGILSEETGDAEQELDNIMESVQKSPEVNEILHRFPHRSNRWSSYWDASEEHCGRPAVDKPYKTVHLSREIGKQGGQLASSTDVELRQLRRRKTEQSLPSTNMIGTDVVESSVDPEGDKTEESTYFTVHRYIPLAQLRRGLMSPRRISSGAFFPMIAIPKVSRFQIAKVPEAEGQGQRTRVPGSSTALPTISEQETMPLISQSNLPV